MVGTVLNSLAVMYFSFFPGIHLSATQMAAIGTICTAVTAIVAAFLITPVNLGAINAGVSTILVAAASFGLHLSSHDIAVAATAVCTVLGYLLREKVEPAVKHPRPVLRQ